MKNKIAALTFAALTALTGAGILVHQGVTVAQENGQGVTSPARTVIMAEPEPCPYPYPLAICAPEPPAPLEVVVPDEPMTEVAAEYSAVFESLKTPAGEEK